MAGPWAALKTQHFENCILQRANYLDWRIGAGGENKQAELRLIFKKAEFHLKEHFIPFCKKEFSSC